MYTVISTTKDRTSNHGAETLLLSLGSYRTQVMPNQLVMVIARPIDLNVSCKLHPCPLQKSLYFGHLTENKFFVFCFFFRFFCFVFYFLLNKSNRFSFISFFFNYYTKIWIYFRYFTIIWISHEVKFDRKYWDTYTAVTKKFLIPSVFSFWGTQVPSNNINSAKQVLLGM